MKRFWSLSLLVAMAGAWACGGSNTPPGPSGAAPTDPVTQVPSSTSAAPLHPAAPPVAPPSGEAATAVLYGRVIGSDQTGAAPQDWQVRVTAEYEDGSDVPPRDRDSTGDLFAFKVVPGKRVRLYFEAVPYQATITEFVDVTDERRYASRLPDVVMERIRWTMALFAEGNGEAFGRNLEAQAAVAEKTGSADIFRANLEFLRKASAKFPDCMRKIEEFERAPRGVALTRQAEARGVPVALLTSLVMTPAELAQSEPDALRALASNPRVARSLRNEAARVLAVPPDDMRQVDNPKRIRPEPSIPPR